MDRLAERDRSANGMQVVDLEFLWKGTGSWGITGWFSSG